MPNRAAISKRLKDPAYGPQPPGNFSFGTQLYGGPTWSDAFKSNRAPSPLQLVENYGALVYAMVTRNVNAVSRLPMRLLMDGSRGQGGPPKRNCDPVKVSRAIGQRLARSQASVSPAAIDQIYEVRDHDLLKALDNPDPYGYFNRRKLIGHLVASQDVIGGAHLVPDGNGWDWTKSGQLKGPFDFLWVIYTQYVLPIRLQHSPLINFWQYFGDRIPFDGAIWFRQGISLRDPYGAAFSPTYAGESYRKQEQEQVAIYSQVLGLGPRPNMVASAKDALMPPGRDEADAFGQDLVRKQAAGYAGGVLINTGAWDFTPMSYSPADMGGKEVSEYDLHRLASIFGQPPTYYTVDTNMANLEAADEQHWRDGIEPRCVAIADTFTQIARMFDPRLSFQFDHGLIEDEESKMKVVEMRLRNGLTTPNQENEEGQWPAFPEGDEHWIDGSLKTMTMMMEEHATNMETQKAAIDSQGTQDELAEDNQEHTQDMDKKGHELAKKKLTVDAKAKQKPPARSVEPSVEELCRTVLMGIQQSLPQ